MHKSTIKFCTWLWSLIGSVYSECQSIGRSFFLGARSDHDLLFKYWARSDHDHIFFNSFENEPRSDCDLDQIIFRSFLEHILYTADNSKHKKVPSNFPKKFFDPSNNLYCIFIAFLYIIFLRCQILKEKIS